MKSGLIVPAAFQRPYMWTQHDVEAFWKSLVNGWPTGSILLWNPASSVDRESMGKTRIGPIESNGKWTSMLLDGQNRMATMAWSLMVPGDALPDENSLSDAEHETWMNGQRLVCDWETRSIRFVPDEEANVGYRVPVAVLVDTVFMSRTFRKLFKDGMESDEPLIWIDELSNKVREARTACTTLERATADEAVDAFRNIARVGQPVTAEDLENALEWLKNSNGPKP